MENNYENAKNFLNSKSIKDTIYDDGDWRKGGLSDLLIEYANSVSQQTPNGTTDNYNIHVVSSSYCHSYVSNNVSVKDYCDRNCEKCSNFY